MATGTQISVCRIKIKGKFFIRHLKPVLFIFEFVLYNIHDKSKILSIEIKKGKDPMTIEPAKRARGFLQDNMKKGGCASSFNTKSDGGSGASIATPVTQNEKGQATKQRRWEQRMEKKRIAKEQAILLAEDRRKQDEAFMREAIRQAGRAAAVGDVPIGCVVVHKGQIIARGYNRRNADKSVLSHAEISAIRKACKKLGDWRLEDCVLYVTLEPCPMCAGAIVQARIPRVVIGCTNPKAGCAGSVLDMLHQPGFNHQAETETGILGEECSLIMKEFFQDLRHTKKTGVQ